jgi:hypothetical protein
MNVTNGFEIRRFANGGVRIGAVRKLGTLKHLSLSREKE